MVTVLLVLKVCGKNLTFHISSSIFKYSPTYVSASDGIHGKTEIRDRLSAHVQDSESSVVPWFHVSHDSSICSLWPHNIRLICSYYSLLAHRMGYSSRKLLVMFKFFFFPI